MRCCKFLAALFLILLISSNGQAQKQFKTLLITTTRGWHHEALHTGVLAMQQLGVKNNFDVVLLESNGGITDQFMNQFAAVIFLHTTGDILNANEQKVMERFIQSGKGFVGVHSASDTEYDWEWYTKLVGRMFKIHPAVQTAKMQLTDNKFPGLEGFANGRLWTDEWYDFGPEKTTGLQYILGVDESSYNAKVQWGENKTEGMGKFHPVAWYHNFDGGRAFYTALGHVPATFSDAAFQNHLLAGILWAATGKK